MLRVSERGLSASRCGKRYTMTIDAFKLVVGDGMLYAGRMLCCGGHVPLSE
jgi:hypothetical protein